MAVQFKCPVQKLAFEISEDRFYSAKKYKKIVLEHDFNHSVCSSACMVVSMAADQHFTVNVLSLTNRLMCSVTVSGFSQLT